MPGVRAVRRLPGHRDRFVVGSEGIPLVYRVESMGRGQTFRPYAPVAAGVKGARPNQRRTVRSVFTARTPTV
jgi:hypothetical protein